MARYAIKRFSMIYPSEKYFASFDTIIKGLKKVGRGRAATTTEATQATARGTGRTLALRAKEAEQAFREAGNRSSAATFREMGINRRIDNMGWFQKNILQRGKYKRLQELQAKAKANTEEAGQQFREALQNKELTSNQFNDFRASVRKQKSQMEGVVERQAQKNAAQEAAAQERKARKAATAAEHAGQGDTAINDAIIREQKGRTGEYTQQRGQKKQKARSQETIDYRNRKQLPAIQGTQEVAQQGGTTNLPAVITEKPTLPQQVPAEGTTTVSFPGRQPQGSVLKPEGEYTEFVEIKPGATEGTAQAAAQQQGNNGDFWGRLGGFVSGVGSGFGVGKLLGRSGKQGMSTGTKVALSAGGVGLAGAGYMAGRGSGDTRQVAFSVKRFSRL